MSDLAKLGGKSVNVLTAVVGGPKRRRFKAPKVQRPPKDIADRLEWAADGADEIGLGDDGLRGGSKLLRDAAAEIRRLRSRAATREDER